MDKYIVLECDSPDCEITEQHWVVYHDETGVGISDHFSESEAKKDCDALNSAANR